MFDGSLVEVMVLLCVKLNTEQQVRYFSVSCLCYVKVRKR